MWQEWEAWGTCSVECGTGTRSRQRRLELQPAAQTSEMEQAYDRSHYDSLQNRIEDYESQRNMSLIAAFACGGLSLFIGMLAVKLLSRRQTSYANLAGYVPAVTEALNA
jgi:hypothetical protein